jgi:hypothetical protein
MEDEQQLIQDILRGKPTFIREAPTIHTEQQILLVSAIYVLVSMFNTYNFKNYLNYRSYFVYSRIYTVIACIIYTIEEVKT